MDFNADKVVYHYVCRNLNLFDKIQEKWFTNPYIAKLFKLSKLFFDNFKVAIFDVNNPNITQIENFAVANKELVETDSLLTKDENLRLFLTNAEHVIKHDYKQYSLNYINELINATIEWHSFQDGLKQAVEYQKINKPKSLDEMRKIIAQCKEYVSLGASVRLDNDLGVDFYDPEAHIQPPQGELLNSGFRSINEWVCGNTSGGFERGTTSIFISLPNIGKSIFLGNLAYNMHLNGHNVLLVSLEMATYKILRRIGANAFDIPIKEYENLAGNQEKIGNLIKDFKNKCNTELIPPGTFKLKRFGSATIDDIMALVFKLEDQFGITFEGIVIDYFTELQNKYGLSSDDMYSYHKQNMNDMFNAGVEHNKAMITAHQVKVNGQNLNDMSLSSLSESSGIAFRPDNIFAIIQPPEMKQQKLFQVKNIKSRDSEFKDYRTTFKIDYTKMRLTGMDDQLEPNMNYI